MRRKSKRQKTRVKYSDLLGNDSDNELESELTGGDKSRDNDSENEYTADQSDGEVSIEDVSIKEESLETIDKKRARTSENFVRTSKQAVASKSRFSSSLKERFKLFYGQYGPYYVRAVRERINWGSEPFYMEKERMRENMGELQNELNDVDGDTLESSVEIDSTGQQLEDLTSSQHDIYNPSSSSFIDVTFSRDAESKKRLKSLEMTSIPNLKAWILNLGGIISSISWAPGHNSETKQYLAISVKFSESWDPINIDVLSLETSSFTKTNGPCTIFILEMDFTQSEPLKFIYSYSSDYGNISKIAWRPRRCSKTDSDIEIIGDLAMICGDGSVRILHVEGSREGKTPENGKKHFKILNTAEEYSLNSNITAICWRSTNCLVVGTTDGELGEFNVVDNSDERGITSFYLPISPSLITAISCASPEDEDVIGIASTDGFIRVIDIKDVRRSRTSAPRTKHFTPCIDYSSQLNSFVALEDNCTTKILPIRRMHTTLAGTGISRHSGSVTNISTSKYHPFILSGGADGCIKMGNGVRRIMVNSKKGNEVYKSVKLWQLNVSTTDRIFSMDDNIEIEKIPAHQDTDNQYVFPACVNVTEVDWNCNFSCGNVYAASMAGGILRVEIVE